MKTLPKTAKKYFWDVDLKKLKLPEGNRYIVKRLLEHGDIASLRWLFRNIKLDIIKEILFKEKGLSPRSAVFWALFLNIPKDKILCLKKSYQKMRRSHWAY